MNQGNPNKVNAIVDEIVENNNVFKLKSPIEQDKEKDSIAKSINSALSVLNEVGKELVLQELSVDPDEKFKGFIDSVGNVDISGLSQMTATIVKEKIIEAEKEGIDLRQGQPVFKDNTKALLVGGVLTVAVIDTMIRDYDNLSDKEIQTIIENYSDLPPEMQNAFNNKQADRLDQIADNIDDEKTKQAVKEQSKMTRVLVDKNQKEAEEFSKSSNKTQIIINTYREVSKSILELGKIYKNNAVLRLNQEIGEPFSLDEETSLEEILSKKSEQELIEIFEKLQSIRDEFVHQANEAQKEKSKTKENETSEEKGTRHEEMRNISLMVIGVTKDLDKKNFPDLDKSETENSKNVGDKVKEVDKNPESPYNDSSKVQQPKSVNLIKTEIERLPNALMKSGFSQEEISEALKTYSEFIGGLNGKEDLQLFFDSESPTNEQICLGLKNVFENFKKSLEPNSYKILQQLAQNDFGGHLQEFLTNPQLLQEKFLPTLEAEMQKLDEKQITDSELEQAKNTEKIKEEFLDASGAIESQKQQESTKLDSPNIPTTPEEHIQESVTSYEQEALEEASQNMAIVKQDNSFIGKIKRVFANMKDMKNKDTSKGFFARLGDSIKSVFGKKNEYFESQDNSKEQANESSTSKIEQPLSFDQQLQQGVTQPIINQPSKNSPSKVTHNPEKNDDEIEFE